MKDLPSLVVARHRARRRTRPASTAWLCTRESVLCHWASACERATVARTLRFWLGFDAASSMTFQYSVIAASAERRSCSSGSQRPGRCRRRAGRRCSDVDDPPVLVALALGGVSSLVQPARATTPATTPQTAPNMFRRMSLLRFITRKPPDHPLWTPSPEVVRLPVASPVPIPWGLGADVASTITRQTTMRDTYGAPVDNSAGAGPTCAYLRLLGHQI